MSKVETFWSGSKYGWRLRNNDNTIELTRAAAFPSTAGALTNAKAGAEAITAALVPSPPTSTTPPTAVKDLVVNVVGPGAVMLSWVNPAGAAWPSLVYGRDGTDVGGTPAWEGLLPAGATSAPLTGLKPDTAYNVYVQPVGGDRTIFLFKTPAWSTPVPPPTPVPPLVTGKMLLGGMNYGRPDAVYWWERQTGTNATLGQTYTEGSLAHVGMDDGVLNSWFERLRQNPEEILVLSVALLQLDERGQWDRTDRDPAWRAFFQKLHDSGLGHRIIARVWEVQGYYDGDRTIAEIVALNRTRPADDQIPIYTFAWGPLGPTAAHAAEAAAGNKRCYRRKVEIAMEVAPEIRWSWGTNGWDANCEQWYPGDDVVDDIHIDTYDMKQYFISPDPAVRWRDSTLPQLEGIGAFAARHGKTVSCGEWGVTTDNPLFIRNMIRWFRARNSLYMCYFNMTDGGVGVTLADLPDSLKAFQEEAAALAAA
jgi:hypothetical protein